MGQTPSSGSTSPGLPPPNHTIDSIGRSYTVVWCDPTIGSTENSLDDSNTIIRLTRIVNKKRQLIHTFRDMKPCQDFLTQVNHVCLIVSGTMGERLVPLVHNLEQIHSIYVFCLNRQIHQLWAKHYSKIRGVFNKIDDICKDLKAYFMPRLAMEYDQLQFEIFARQFTLPINSSRELAFLYSLSTKMLLTSIHSSKDELIEYCRREFTNDYQIRSIRDLDQNYAQHDVTWWFTKDKFFQEIINQALATHDLHTLYAMNYLIKNLERRLESLQTRPAVVNQVQSQPLILYFSQTLSLESLQQIRSNQGGLMCINEFLFANSEQTIASVLIEGPTSTPANSREVNVLFEIQIPSTIEPNVAYANIGAVCRFVHQKEYLFGMSSVFRIIKIEPIRDVRSAWFVRLTMVDRKDPQLDAIQRGIFDDFLHDETDFVESSLTLKSKLSLFKVTRKFFEQILNFNLEQIRSVLRHYHLAMIHCVFNDFNRAIDEFRSGINLILCPRSSDRRNDDHICLIPFYSSLGVALQENNNSIDSFLEAYQALRILGQNKDHPLYTPCLAAAVHFNLGSIKEKQSQDSEAIVFYTEALRLRSLYLAEDHPDRIQLENLLETLNSRTTFRL